MLLKPIYKNFINYLGGKHRNLIYENINNNINYFNCTGLVNDKEYRYIRKQYIKDNIFVSDIVDSNDNVILKHKLDGNNIISYEDPRMINEYEFSLSVSRYNSNVKFYDKVSVGKYNINTNELKIYKTQNNLYEKNWQFLDNGNILYSLDPFIILNNNEEIIYNKQYDFSEWINRYGDIRLSTNPFVINNKKYILFHSAFFRNKLEIYYYNGLMQLNDDYTPYGYYINPFCYDDKDYDGFNYVQQLYEWKKQYDEFAKMVYVKFLMNVCVSDRNVIIYGGKYDCDVLKIIIPINEFENELRNKYFIFL